LKFVENQGLAQPTLIVREAGWKYIFNVLIED